MADDKKPPRRLEPPPEIKMGRATLPPGMLDAKRRYEWGLPADDEARGDYMVELNLLFREGIQAAAAKFKKLYDEVVHPENPQDLVKIAKTYYSCKLSVSQLKQLIQADEQDPDDKDKKNEPKDRCIYKIWPDFPIKPLIDRSVATIKADAAFRAFAASGRGITWAVIDSGINASHPHFGPQSSYHRHLLLNEDVASLHRNFLLEDPDADPDKSEAERKNLREQHRATALVDEFGHGTHVAGVIAGGLEGQEKLIDLRIFERKFESDGGGKKLKETVEERTQSLEPGQLRGMAPGCRMISLKVLDGKGAGKTSDVIRALNYIRENLNDDPKFMRVHGVNLSIGYEFDAEMFACGQSPLCVEVDRLVQSGVVVVVAAGNTGYGTALSQERNTRVGLANTINDPGNAAMAITVGATHRDAPHTYGISYFSSKGPTGDGRLKPDLVAPGERITSCVAGQMLEDIKKKVKGTTLAPLESGAAGPELPLAAYLDANGTSMAAPHVSGAIAAFLSIRREFIGKPLEVKRIFLASATSLGRERYFEGHGLVDLMRAIQSV